MKRKMIDRLAFYFFSFAVTVLAFGYGVAVGKYQIFPYWLISNAEELGQSLISPWYYRSVEKPYLARIRNTDQAMPGLNLVTRVAAGRELAVEIMDMDGRTLHAWNTDWFTLWPRPEHLPEDVVPKSKPGTHIHGAVILKNGDLVFNFEHLGLICLNRNSQVVWRLPYRTHHTVHVHDDGNLWVCGQRLRREPDPRFPHREPPFDEYTILEVTPRGKILEIWSVSEILYKNGRAGLLHLNTAEWSPQIRNDLLHLNDVEPFPTSMEEGFFKKGDILVSLRNINTIFVFNRYSKAIKYISTGMFVRQHDPDFLDGNRFSVLDNFTASAEGGFQSRIVIVSVPNSEAEVFFEGSSKTPFFTSIMGKHQWLPNGNLLIMESLWGRAFELNREGEIVWEYVNYVDEGIVGLVEEVQRLPSDYTQLFIGE